MKIKFVGDTHGRDFYNNPVHLPPGSVQLGDFDLCGYNVWPNAEWLSSQNMEIEESWPRFFIDGNHDAFPRLNLEAKEPYSVSENLFHIPRGYVDGEVLFIGGADSIDRPARVEGRDWFPEESLSYSQFNAIMDMDRKITVVVSHDCPDFVWNSIKNPDMFLGWEEIPSPHRFALREIFDKFKPELWIFGHHHRNIQIEMCGCFFQCLPEGAKKDFDVPIDPFGMIACAAKEVNYDRVSHHVEDEE